MSIGLTAADHLLETLANPETGTWTVFLTTPDKIACVIASGTMFNSIMPVAKETGN